MTYLAEAALPKDLEELEVSNVVLAEPWEGGGGRGHSTSLLGRRALAALCRLRIYASNISLTICHKSNYLTIIILRSNC